MFNYNINKLNKLQMKNIKNGYNKINKDDYKLKKYSNNKFDDLPGKIINKIKIRKNHIKYKLKCLIIKENLS